VPIAILEISTGSNDQEGSSAMIFIDNKYTAIYYKIVEQAKQRNHIKQSNDGYQTHHIVPRCIGGTNDPNNLVVLTFKEHRVCHCLLIKMQLTKNAEIKMRHSYGFFNKSSRYNGPRYKSGKDNIFSTPEIVEQVRQRMKENNPMKALEQRQRMSQNNNNPNVRSLSVDGVSFLSEAEACRYFDTTQYLLRKNYNIQYTDKRPKIARIFNLNDKFITPQGIFKTKKEIQKVVGIPEWTLNTIYNDLDAYPVTNGRASKKINHLNIDPTKTWRDNGFGLLAVP
jgi:hypothetical protein